MRKRALVDSAATWIVGHAANDRAWARVISESAQEALSLFEDVHPDDRRPRNAVEAALAFAGGAKRTRLQRTSALVAHEAAQDATNEAAREAARAAGHATASAYLHPLSRSTQVKHILGAAGSASANPRKPKCSAEFSSEIDSVIEPLSWRGMVGRSRGPPATVPLPSMGSEPEEELRRILRKP